MAPPWVLTHWICVYGAAPSCSQHFTWCLCVCVRACAPIILWLRINDCSRKSWCVIIFLQLSDDGEGVQVATHMSTFSDFLPQVTLVYNAVVARVPFLATPLTGPDHRCGKNGFVVPCFGETWWNPFRQSFPLGQVCFPFAFQSLCVCVLTIILMCFRGC